MSDHPDDTVPLENSSGMHHAGETAFVSSEILLRQDASLRRAKLAQVVTSQIIPRLNRLHSGVSGKRSVLPHTPTEIEIAELAHLVLSPDLDAASSFITRLRDLGVSTETLFIELLEPAARFIGTMWDNDECDFIDVSLGLGRLQLLLAMFEMTHIKPDFHAKRTVLLATTPGERHSFGLSMVKKFLIAGGWGVTSAEGCSQEELGEVAADSWFSVVGLTLGSYVNFSRLSDAMLEIRDKSQNRAIRIMVGGPIFLQQPELVKSVGADGTAVNAPSAVLLAQKLMADALRDVPAEEAAAPL
jgi:MerR family transcriptional regulator, light-induced transcriptional regulator